MSDIQVPVINAVSEVRRRDGMSVGGKPTFVDAHNTIE
jgi:hypothetical protein